MILLEETNIKHKLQTAYFNLKSIYQSREFLPINFVKSNEPQYLFEKVRFRTETHNVNLRSKHQLTLPIHYTEQFKSSFSYNIVKFYNNLPNDLRFITSKSAFKLKFTQVLMCFEF
nr:unnamed protein product [Callosobruchus analis]